MGALASRHADRDPGIVLASGVVLRRQGVWQRWRRRLWLLPALAAGALVVLVAWAARYQPLGEGGLSIPYFPGMPAGKGLRVVNDFGNLPGELYVPPQRGPVSLTESIWNSGPWAVTIVSVGFAGPYAPPSGRILYVPFEHFLRQSGQRLRAKPVSGLVLQPNGRLVLAIRFRVPSCVDPKTGGYVDTSALVVKERFFGFSHSAYIPLIGPGQGTTGIVWQIGSKPGTGTVCAK